MPQKCCEMLQVMLQDVSKPCPEYSIKHVRVRARERFEKSDLFLTWKHARRSPPSKVALIAVENYCMRM